MVRSIRLVALACMFLAAACSDDPPEWSVRVAGSGQSLGENNRVGLDLSLDLAVGLDDGQAPSNLRFLVDHPEAVEIDVLGTIGHPAGGQAVHVRIVPTLSGANQIRFLCDETREKLSVRYDALTVDDVVYTVESTEGTPRRGHAVRLFTASQATVRPIFRRDGQELLGTRPLLVVAPPGAGTVVDGNELTVGPAEHIFEVGTDLLSTPLAVQAVSVADIAQIDWRHLSPHTGTHLTLPVGLRFIIEVTPLAIDGKEILGWPRPAHSSNIVGGLVEDEGRPSQLSYRATAAGPASVTVAWGAARLEFTVDVIPSAGNP